MQNKAPGPRHTPTRCWEVRLISCSGVVLARLGASRLWAGQLSYLASRTCQVRRLPPTPRGPLQAALDITYAEDKCPVITILMPLLL